MTGESAKELLGSFMDGLTAGGEEIAVMAEILPAMREFVEQFGTDDFVCTMHPLPPTPPTSHPGLDGLTDAWSDYGEAFETVRVRFQDIRESHDALVVLVDQIATTRHGGVEITQPSATVWRFERGRIAEVQFHLDHDAALEAAGLGPRLPGEPKNRT